MNIYLGVEDVILRQSCRQAPFELVPCGFGFLKWLVERFDCRWLTRLDHAGDDSAIRVLIRDALDDPALTDDLDLLFYMIQPTYWEDAKVEGIDFDRDFLWITRNIDAQSLAVLERRQMTDRLIRCSPRMGADEFAKMQLRLEGYAS